jgi:hypothetical protein
LMRNLLSAKFHQSRLERSSKTTTSRSRPTTEM